MAPNRGQKGKIDKNPKTIIKVTTTSISDDNVAKKAKKELQNNIGDQLCKSDAKSPAKDVPEIASKKVKSQSHDRKSVPNSSNSKSEKPFGCSFCKKRFALAITAQDHEIVHMKDNLGKELYVPVVPLNLGLNKSPEDTAAKGHEKKAKTSEQKLKSRSHDQKSVPDSSNSKSEKQLKEHHDLNKSPEDTVPKGQLISKCLFGVFNSPKKQTKTIRPLQ